jgi:hypothetical protein
MTLRFTCLFAPVLTITLACGPGEADTSDSAGSSSSASTTGTATSTSASTGTSTDDPTTTAASTITGTATTATTTTTTTTTTGEVTTSTGELTTEGPGTTLVTTTGTTGEPGEGEYAAMFWSGGLNHIIVRKRDLNADLCAVIGFAWPTDAPPELTLPDQWGLQFAQIGQGAATCFDDLLGPLDGGVNATAAQGTAAWDEQALCPPLIDIDVTLTFPQDQPWVPADDHLAALQIATQGC